MTPTPEFDKQVLRLAEHGLLEREIADNLGSSRARVRNAIGRLRKLGCTHFESRYKVMIREREAQVTVWLNEGLSQDEIARRLGVTPVMAHRIVHRILGRAPNGQHQALP
jgi:DNA-binding CsgD family transcriptional regulator